MNIEVLKQIEEWVVNYQKTPYVVSPPQVLVLDHLLKQINMRGVTDKTCGVCIKNAVDQLLHYYTNNIAKKVIDDFEELVNTKRKPGRPKKKEIE